IFLLSILSSVNDLFNTSFCNKRSDVGTYVTVIAYSCDPKDFAQARAYSAALNEFQNHLLLLIYWRLFYLPN
ncbi:MAG TPA: hypothetical protein VN703_06945, partial [Candidatus Sulfopaludibacter sp.]|nr:hypothetical protein [Candidatus Sulfopaludibacter sp.]